jgi:transposase
VSATADDFLHPWRVCPHLENHSSRIQCLKEFGNVLLRHTQLSLRQRFPLQTQNAVVAPLVPQIRRKRKNDRIDANKLARLGRVDPQSLHPMQHRSREVRQDLVVLRARDALVAARTELINATRGLVKSMGSRLPKCSSPSFAQKVEETVPVELRDALLPLVRMAAALSDCIQGYDEKIEKLGREKYGHTALLRQVKGVGPITALAYVLTLENPDRFVKSRVVGPYLGLVPKQEDSGESQPQLGLRL